MNSYRYSAASSGRMPAQYSLIVSSFSVFGNHKVQKADLHRCIETLVSRHVMTFTGPDGKVPEILQKAL